MSTFRHWICWLNEPFSYDPPAHAIPILTAVLAFELLVVAVLLFA